MPIPYTTSRFLARITKYTISTIIIINTNAATPTATHTHHGWSKAEEATMEEVALVGGKVGETLGVAVEGDEVGEPLGVVVEEGEEGEVGGGEVDAMVIFAT